ncbi:MAG: hypothetical protein FJW66_03175 [Actinobacteria bacterium]|nr:hypothetical protein [Actinomycetota bacterium]
MEEKNVKKLLDKQTEEIKRQGKMLLEEFDHRIKIIAEVQIEQSQRFEDIDEKLAEHDKKSDIINAKLDAIMEMTATNAENIELIKSALRRKVDIEEFDALIKRVMVLEKKLLPFT